MQAGCGSWGSRAWCRCATWWRRRLLLFCGCFAGALLLAGGADAVRGASSSVLCRRCCGVVRREDKQTRCRALVTSPRKGSEGRTVEGLRVSQCSGGELCNRGHGSSIWGFHWGVIWGDGHFSCIAGSWCCASWLHACFEKCVQPSGRHGRLERSSLCSRHGPLCQGAVEHNGSMPRTSHLAPCRLADTQDTRSSVFAASSQRRRLA